MNLSHQFRKVFEAIHTHTSTEPQVAIRESGYFLPIDFRKQMETKKAIVGRIQETQESQVFSLG